MREVSWILLATFVALVATQKACDVKFATECFDRLAHYETQGFPFYGSNEEELTQTCTHMEGSFNCIENYRDTCKDHETCDEKCKEMLEFIDSFTHSTGLRDLSDYLCNVNSSMRYTYLENYQCLKGNALEYENCHNGSTLSSAYLNTLEDRQAKLDATCCYFSWFQDCFTNITKERCNDDITEFVSVSLQSLVGVVARQLCESNPIICREPPYMYHSSSTVVHAFNNWLLLCFLAMFPYIISIK